MFGEANNSCDISEGKVLETDDIEMQMERAHLAPERERRLERRESAASGVSPRSSVSVSGGVVDGLLTVPGR